MQVRAAVRKPRRRRAPEGSRAHLVDSRYAWFVALTCCWVQVWSTMVMRSSGVLLVSLVANFRISRRLASWPFEIALTANCFQGLACGIMLRYLDGRTMTMVATLCATLSGIACFVWDNLAVYYVFIGLVFGAATGTTICTNVVVLNSYFVRRKASASGLNFAGASLGSMIFPPLIAKLTDWYGLQGTMLIIGAMVLNAMVGAFVLRSPRESRDADDQLPASLGSVDYMLSDPMAPVPPPGPIAWTGNHGKERAASFLWQPLFYPLILTGVVYGIVFSTYIVTIVDHVRDVSRVSSGLAALSVTAMSVGDLASRLVSGYITDRKFITREQLLVINFGSLGLCYVLLTFLTGLSYIALLALVFGLNAGGPIISIPVLLAEHCGNHHLPITFGIHRLFMGVSTLGRPFLIGYFKDTHGSYNGLYYLVGVCSVATALLWMAIIGADGCKTRLARLVATWRFTDEVASRHDGKPRVS
ncbi:hypothetical protein ISCGN_032562 [Ixodes scapularis]